MKNISAQTYIIKNKIWTYYCVEWTEEQSFILWSNFDAIKRKYIRPIPTKQTYTIEATEEQYKKIKEILS